MITRFQGEEGQKRLVAALRIQKIVQDDEELATAIAEVAEIIQIEPNSESSEFIKQNDSDNDVYLIISGKVSISINGQELAVRETGNHVGEMALIDTTARRSAAVIAIEQTVLAKISEHEFSAIAQQYPQLWRRLALELANRLLERNKHVRTPNHVPKLFIGSSREGLSIARAIQLGLDHDPLEARVWTDGIFRASSSAIEDLIQAVEVSDFAVLVISPDDTVESRDTRTVVPRDNVIFELGLFIGALGRERIFVIKPRGKEIKMPSDLLGLNPIEYSADETVAVDARVAPICTNVRRVLKELGSK